MPANQSTPEVTRADRELAATILLRQPNGNAERARSGGSDSFWLLKALARHRLASATPARGGEELREAEQWLRAISDWLLTHDHDMTLPDGILDTDPLDIADRLAALASTDMAGAGEACADCGGLNIGCPDGCAAPPVEGLTSGDGRDKAIERAARYVLENSRRGNASLNSEQYDADTDKLMAAYRDIIGKAIDSGALASPKATATASVRDEGAVVCSGCDGSGQGWFGDACEKCEGRGRLALADSGTAATIGGERA